MDRKVLLMVIVLSTVLVFASIFTGCAAEEDMAEPDTTGEVNTEQMEMTYSDDAEQAETTEEKRSRESETEQKLILNGHIELTVDNAEQSREEIGDYVEEQGGYIERSSFRTSQDDKLTGSITARIPQEYFQETMEFIAELGEVRHRETSSEDVTMEYVDMEARLNNLERQEERYLEILSEAESIEDILSIEEQLSRVREEIETMTARLEQLEDQVSYSTIEIQIIEADTVEAKVEASGFDGLWNRMSAAFTTSIDGVITAITELAVVLSGAIPYLLVLSVLAVIFYRFRKKLLSLWDKTTDDENQ